MNTIYKLADLTSVQLTQLESKYNVKFVQVDSSIYTFKGKGKGDKSYTIFLGGDYYSYDHSSFYTMLLNWLNDKVKIDSSSIVLFDRVEVDVEHNRYMIYAKALVS
ncbi:MAG: hypothetical protein E6R13_01495 [Spirochaetes bacterium]|nr:MAG: hypothetical protein E6R13_01495 [Spirochaetota bacterium]